MPETTITIDGQEHTGTPLGPPAILNDGDLVTIKTADGEQLTGWRVE